jgi:hypothetical protein
LKGGFSESAFMLLISLERDLKRGANSNEEYLFNKTRTKID